MAISLGSDQVRSTPPRRSCSVPPGLARGMIVAEKYELTRKLGTGGMGEVWAARHQSLNEEIALKLVVRNVDHEDGTSSDSRFLLEARVAAALSRKTRHIAAVTDHGADGSLAYLVMELLEGESLDALVDRVGMLSLEEAASIVSQIARGLSVAHAEGVLHRDLKPSNVFIAIDEEARPLVKILDFGIAKLRRPQKGIEHATMRGFLLGTPAYMSPEQALAKPIDHRADVWALAVIAYHLLTGEFPFDGVTAEDLLANLCVGHRIAIRERRPELPAVVEHFFERAFATKLADRFQSALALAGAFEQLEPLAQARSAPPRRESTPLRELASEISVIAAGVPTRGDLVGRIIAVAIVAVVILATGWLVQLYFEGEAPAPRSIPAMTHVREAVPPPEEPTIAAPPVSATPLPLPATRPTATAVIAPRPRSAPDRSEIF